MCISIKGVFIPRRRRGGSSRRRLHLFLLHSLSFNVVSWVSRASGRSEETTAVAANRGRL